MTNEERTSITKRFQSMITRIEKELCDISEMSNDAHAAKWGGKQDGHNAVWREVENVASGLSDRVDVMLTEAKTYQASAEDRKDDHDIHYWKGKVDGIEEAWKVVKRKTA